jgi:hypothetical protein
MLTGRRAFDDRRHQRGHGSWASINKPAKAFAIRGSGAFDQMEGRVQIGRLGRNRSRGLPAKEVVAQGALVAPIPHRRMAAMS